MSDDWNRLNKDDISTYPENNQDVLVWDDFKGYVICTHYEKVFEDANGNILEHVLGWVSIPGPIESKLKFISRA